MRRFIVGLTALSLAVSSCQFAVAGVSCKVMDRFERSGQVLQDQFSLGGDASISAGPIGRTAEAGTDILLRSEIYSYARSRGLFAGVALDGARMYQDGDVNKDLYGHEIKPQDILIAQKVGMP